MEYEVLESGHEDGGDRVFYKVAIWYDDNRDQDQPPDVVEDFLIHPGPAATTAFVTDTVGQRRTVSGKWMPTMHEVDGDWVDYPPAGPPGDPWEVVEIPETDPIEWLERFVLQAGQAYRTNGGRGSRLGPDFKVTKRKPPKAMARVARSREIVGHVGRIQEGQ